MKKLFFALIFFIFFGFLAFTDTDEQEEIGYLVFALNSSSLFENERQAVIQLDTITNYLAGKNLYPGQIHVYGYTASAANDIDSETLSRDRAIFVINELQKRGISKELFSDPIGYGAVDTWGSNNSEGDKIPNRRVRIVLGGNTIMPVIPQLVDQGVKSANAENKETMTQENSRSEQKVKFPWWLILLAVLAIITALLFLLSKLLENKKTSKSVTDKKSGIIIAPIAAPAVTNEIVVNLDEEILYRAYELYQQRNGQSEDAVADWHNAVQQICSRYEADGYRTYADAGSWWACR